MHISDIDGATTDEDLIEAIMTVTGTNDREVVKIRSMRTNRNGGQVAIVAARKDIAEKLLRADRIRVGLINCRTREWVHLVRCFRCLQYGHQQSECKEEDNADACRKCGEKGHKEKGCEKESYCFTCKTRGHRNSEMKCPHFKTLLKDKHEKEVRRKTNSTQ